MYTGTTLAILSIDGNALDEKEKLKRSASRLGISFFRRIRDVIRGTICRPVTMNFLGQGKFLGIRALRETLTYNIRKKSPPGKKYPVFHWKLLQILF